MFPRSNGSEVFYGEAGRHPAGQDSVFGLWSMTKPIVAVAMLMLYDEGCFQLEDPICKWLPSFQNMDVLVSGEDGNSLQPATTQITVEHLLSHRAGFSHGFDVSGEVTPVDQLYAESGMCEYDHLQDVTLEEFVERLAGLPLVHNPGDEVSAFCTLRLFKACLVSLTFRRSQWHYSVAFDVCGRLIEILSGKSLRDFLHERIFIPLEMTGEIIDH